ncbi:MAG: Ger(x)C family spore germination protein, partial [Bacteroidota bacterium]
KRYLLIILSLLTVSGCWDLEEVDRRAFITNIGIDIDSRNQVRMTIQIPLLKEVLPPGARPDSGGKDFQTISASGSSVNEAFSALEARTERRLVIQQKQLLIIGAETARSGVNPVLDWLLRSPKTPPHCLILVARSPRTAKEILEFTPQTKTMPGLTSDLTRRTVAKSDRTYFMESWLFRQKLLYDPKDAYATLIDIDQTQGKNILEGLAVFNGYRMAGELNPEETQAFGLLTNRMKSGKMTFVFSAGIAGPKYSLRDVRGKTKIQVLVRMGQPYFSVHTEVRGELIEVVSARNRNKLTPRLIQRLEKKIATEVETRLSKTIKKLQQFNSDPIDFGEQFRVQHPDLWKRSDWKKVFPQARFRVLAKVKILREGIIR